MYVFKFKIKTLVKTKENTLVLEAHFALDLHYAWFLHLDPRHLLLWEVLFHLFKITNNLQTSINSILV